MTDDSSQESDFFYVLQDRVRMLFADDDPILREFAQVNLNSEQAEVVVAEDGVEALGLIGKQHFDIVMLDLEMPRLDGFGVLQRLRSEEATRNLPVIVVTGREDVFAIDKAFQLGATSFVVKPINWRLMSYQVRYVIRSAQSARPSQAKSAVADPESLRRLMASGRSFLSLVAAECPGLAEETKRYAQALAAFAESSAAQP